MKHIMITSIHQWIFTTVLALTAISCTIGPRGTIAFTLGAASAPGSSSNKASSSSTTYYGFRRGGGGGATGSGGAASTAGRRGRGRAGGWWLLQHAALATKKQPTSIVSPSSTSVANLPSLSSANKQFDITLETHPELNRGPLKVLFLSADTGGGHRASAESLAKQFLLKFPGSSYDLLDVWTTDGILPYKTLVNSYKHLSAHPNQWRFLYHLSNTVPWDFTMDWHSTLMCERKIRKRIASYNPDVIVSVHPAMNGAPMVAARKISKKIGKHIPFFTVVTDLGSAHCTWFQRNVERIYVASDRLYKLARRRGRTPPQNIVMSGLPIRYDFAIQAEQLKDRTSEVGQQYQQQIKQSLGLPNDRPMILVMGGGEGVGSLSAIVNELYVALSSKGMKASICVVCGRNDKLKLELSTRDWQKVVNGEYKKANKRRPVLSLVRRRVVPFLMGRRRSAQIQKSLDRTHLQQQQQQPQQQPNDRSSSAANTTVSSNPDVVVIGLGFITNMAEYMVAADVLVSKAGPGTIAEAAAVGLPVMLTSFLPGQEAGNVDYVLENGFGDYCRDPVEIGDEVSCWLQDPSLLQEMSHRAQAVGQPDAAAEIVLDIGSITHAWMALNAASSKQDSILQES